MKKECHSFEAKAFVAWLFQLSMTKNALRLCILVFALRSEARVANEEFLSISASPALDYAGKSFVVQVVQVYNPARGKPISLEERPGDHKAMWSLLQAHEQPVGKPDSSGEYPLAVNFRQ